MFDLVNQMVYEQSVCGCSLHAVMNEEKIPFFFVPCSWILGRGTFHHSQKTTVTALVTRIDVCVDTTLCGMYFLQQPATRHQYCMGIQKLSVGADFWQHWKSLWRYGSEVECFSTYVSVKSIVSKYVSTVCNKRQVPKNKKLRVLMLNQKDPSPSFLHHEMQQQNEQHTPVVYWKIV